MAEDLSLEGDDDDLDFSLPVQLVDAVVVVVVDLFFCALLLAVAV